MGPFQRHVRNLGFYAITAFGALMSIISIVVVLELRGPVSIPKELEAAKLRESLVALHSLSTARHAAALPTADTAAMRLAEADTSARGRTLLALYQSQRSLAELWQARTTAVVAENGAAAAATALAYEVEAGRPGNRERELRFTFLRNWHQTQTQRADAYLDAGRTALVSAGVAIAAVRQARGAEVATHAAEARAELQAVRALLAQNLSFTPPPPRGDVRLADNWWSWHPFSALSSWLRTQRSLELASLIGMLGFGLLGAAASTVVRKRRKEGDPPEVIGDNLTNLVLSGVSAALATYLAVKGGLAVVSAEGAEPNPYVLLLTCFVAAVYWEEAWERVRRAISREPAPVDGDEEQPRDPQPDPAHDEAETEAGDAEAPAEPKKVQVPAIAETPAAPRPAEPEAPATPEAPIAVG